MSNTITDNPILQYAAAINSGEIIACNKIKLTMKHLCDIVNGKYPYMYYNTDRANHAIDFLQRYCTHIKGKLGGKPLQLMLWQKAIIAATFGILDTNTNLRHYRKLAIIVAKKNGKSLLSSGIGLYMLTSDGEHGAEVYSAATRREQAKIIWDVAYKMVMKSKALNKRCQRRVNGIFYKDGKFQPLSADYGTMDGMDVHCALLDEIHQWKDGKRLYDMIVDGTINRQQPLTVVTSTAGFVRNDLYDMEYNDYTNMINKYSSGNPDLYDDTTLAFVYEQDGGEAEVMNEKTWYKSNPGLGVIKNVDNLRTKYKNSKGNRAKMRNLLCKDFNVIENNGDAYMSYEQCRNTAQFDVAELKPTYIIGGVDLARTTDLCAAKAIFALPNDTNIYVISKYWIPKNKMEYHIKNDGQPYDEWVRQGYVEVCDTDSVEFEKVTAWFRELQDTYGCYLYRCGYDGWSSSYWVNDMRKQFGGDTMMAIAQTSKILSEPMELLYDFFDQKRIIYNDNPVDLWCFCNTTTFTDSNGNVKPNKSSKVNRIDGYAALLDAFVAYLDCKEDYMYMQQFDS